MILLIDDSADMAAMCVSYLERDGFVVRYAPDARSGTEGLAQGDVDLLILDLGLPDRSGLDLLRALRSGVHEWLPVVIVTGRGEEADRVVGLELGADDYLVKPFSLRELAARIRSVLRRARVQAPDPAVIHLGGLMIDTGARLIRAAGELIELTPREYALLAFLAAAPARAFSREQLLDHVWESSADWQARATVDEHVYRLRRKLAAAGVRTPKITTVRGYGYRLDP